MKKAGLTSWAEGGQGARGGGGSFRSDRRIR